MALKYLLNITINGYDIAAILWNIFLALIPFFICGYLIKMKKRKNFKTLGSRICLFVLMFLWLIFIPNTAYIITDVRHLLDYCPLNYDRICVDNAWMIMFFFTYGAIGWFLLVLGLNQFKYFLSEFKYNLEKYFIFFTIPFISLGVLVGLINRHNSWEIFYKPLLVFNNIIIYFSHWPYLKNWLIFTLFIYLLYFCGNIIFVPAVKKTLPAKYKLELAGGRIKIKI